MDGPPSVLCGGRRTDAADIVTTVAAARGTAAEEWGRVLGDFGGAWIVLEIYAIL